MLAAFLLSAFLPATVASAADGYQFTVSPASGSPGEPIHVTAVDPCPPIPGDIGDMPYQDVVLTFVDSAGVSSGDVNLGGIGEGMWDAQAFFPSPNFPPPTFDAVRTELQKRMIARQGEQWMQKMRGESVVLDLKAPKAPEPAQ